MNSGGYINRDAKRRGIFLALGNNPEGDNCFSIYNHNGIKMYFSFKETIQCKPFFLHIAHAFPITLISASTNLVETICHLYIELKRLAIASYGSQSELANAPINGLPQDWGAGQATEFRLRKAHVGGNFDIHNGPQGRKFDSITS